MKENNELESTDIAIDREMEVDAILGRKLRCILKHISRDDVLRLLTIRMDYATVLDFNRYAVRYFISTQQYYEWR